MEVKHKLKDGKLIHEVLEKALDTQTADEGYEWIPEGYARRRIKRVKIHQINLNEMKELKKARFLLRRVHWRGQFVVRGMPVDHWDLLLDKGAKCLDEFAGMENPLKQPEGVSCIRRDYCTGTPEGKPNKEWMKFYGKSIPPNHPEWGNPNKRIPAYMDKVDEDSVNIISDTDTFVSFMFHGKELKGYWIAKRESPTAEMWVFSKSSLPGEPRKEVKQEAHHEDCVNFNQETNKCNFKNKPVDPKGPACPDFIPKEEIQKTGFGRGRGGQRRSWNSPTFAHIATWGTEPDHWIPGRTGDPEKEWKRGIMIDEHLKPEVFDELEKIKEIEVRSSCEGHSKERVSYIVFRLKPKFDKYAKKVSAALDKLDGVYSKSDIGTENRPRIVCAGRTWFGQKSWEKWWNELPSKVASAVKETLGKSKTHSLLTQELKNNIKDFKGNILTETERKFRLENFRKVIAATLDGTDSEPLDEVLIPYLEKINSFPFLITTQSCWGHNKPRDEKKAHFDFRSKLTEKDTIDELVRPMTDKFCPTVGCELMLECDRLRYILWLDNKNWKQQFEYFIDLLKRIPISGRN
ncbi:hypothetical protein ES702_07013 [subsurface metagenome]